MKSRICVLILFFAFNAFGQGLEFNDAKYKETLQKLPVAQQNLELPSQIDLSMFAPEPINQGTSGTCVGMATTYYMRTILEAIDLNLTDKSRITEKAFSPSYTYNLIKNPTDTTCMEGSQIGDALDLLRDKGAIYFSDQGFPYCVENKAIAINGESKILDYIKLFQLDSDSSEIVGNTKKALAELSPVVVAVLTTPNLQNLGFWQSWWARILVFFGIRDSEELGLWQPNISKRVKGGHAICLIGYNDSKFGGAFKAINSQGKNWGDKGYLWIPYTDFIKITKYGYQAFLRENYTEKEVFSETSLDFIDLSGKTLPYTIAVDTSLQTFPLKTYKLSFKVKDKLKFKLALNNKINANYIYVIGGEQESTIGMFPVDTISALIGKNTHMILPSKTKTYDFIADTDQDKIVVLISQKKLNYTGLIQKLRQEGDSFLVEILTGRMPENDNLILNDKKIIINCMENNANLIIPIVLNIKYE